MHDLEMPATYTERMVARPGGLHLRDSKSQSPNTVIFKRVVFDSLLEVHEFLQRSHTHFAGKKRDRHWAAESIARPNALVTGT